VLATAVSVAVLPAEDVGAPPDQVGFKRFVSRGAQHKGLLPSVNAHLFCADVRDLDLLASDPEVEIGAADNPVQASDSGGLFNQGFETTYKFWECNLKRSADVAQLQEVEPAFPRFELADHGLRNSESISQILLPHSRFHPHLSEGRQQSFLLFAIGAQAWAALLHAAVSIRAI
jgi:hypothetical protein